MLVLEARDRVGGRVHTIEPAGFPLDRGAEWLHSADRNPLSPIAQEPRLLDPSPAAGMDDAGCAAAARPSRPRRIGSLPARRKPGRAGRRRREPIDRSLASVLVPGGRWNQLLDATSTWGNGAELDRVSVKDYVRYEDSGVNWRLREGYGRLFERLAEGLSRWRSRPRCRASTIAGARSGIETARGTVTAKRVIVTVPTSILAAEAIRFDPPLPGQAAAAAGLPLGVDDKLFISLSGPLPGIEPDIYLVGSTNSRETMSYQVRPARPAGDLLLFRRALRGGARAGRGGGDVLLCRRRARAAAGQRHPPPHRAARLDRLAAGSVGARLLLLCAARPCRGPRAARRPVDNRLFFAGEACSPNFFSTAHGAYMTGLAAAEAALASLGKAAEARA